VPLDHSHTVHTQRETRGGIGSSHLALISLVARCTVRDLGIFEVCDHLVHDGHGSSTLLSDRCSALPGGNQDPEEACSDPSSTNSQNHLKERKQPPQEHGFQSDRKFENRGSMFIDPTQDLRESLGERSMQAENLNAAPDPLIPNRHVL
jgi:hypothetical protein